MLSSEIGAQAQLVGFAALDTLGQAGTTGGTGGRTVITSSFVELQELCKSEETLQIVLRGTIYGNDMVPVSSNKTIKGEACNSAISGFGFRMLDVKNVIIENISFRNGNKDAVQIADSTHHVWVDHCTFTNYGDGLIDITQGADFVTLSWNVFRKHRKVNLIGVGSLSDTSRLNVTVHHNWYDDVFERCPKVRFGKVHVFNNYYSKIPSYGIRSTDYAEVVAEGNYFYQVDDPLVGDLDEAPGNIKSILNIYEEITGDSSSLGDVNFKPAIYYSYELEAANRVPQTVQGGAGACYNLVTSFIDNEEVLSIYPNPTHDLVKIHGSVSRLTWQVHSLQGVRLLSGSSNTIELAALPLGSYLLWVRSNEIQTIHKIVKL